MAKDQGVTPNYPCRSPKMRYIAGNNSYRLILKKQGSECG
jgi:hypothetical protein